MRTTLNRFCYALLGMGVTLSSAGYGAPGTLSNKPLWIGATVKSNVILSLDDSGSMLWEMIFPSDQGRLRVNGATGSFVYGNGNTFGYYASGDTYNYLSPWAGGLEVPPVSAYGFVRSSEFNNMYYNPAEDYKPWPGYGDYQGDSSDADGDGNTSNFPNAETPLGTAGYTGTKRDPLGTNKVNLFSSTSQGFSIGGSANFVCDDLGTTNGSDAVTCPAGNKNYSYIYAHYYLKKTTGTYSYVAGAGAGGGADTSNSVVLEAEDGTVVGNFSTVTSCTGCSGGYVGNTNDAGVNYSSNPPGSDDHQVRLSFVAPGSTVRIWMRVFAPGGGSDSFWVKVDGFGEPNFTAAGSDDEVWSDGYEKFWEGFGTGSWNWKEWGELSGLTAGNTYTLRVAQREDGTYLDQVYITTTNEAPSGAMSLSPPVTPGLPQTRSCDPDVTLANSHKYYDDFRKKTGGFFWNDASDVITADALVDNSGVEGAIAPDGSCLVKYTIPASGTTFDDGLSTTASVKEAQQNFANWFTYYRRRHYAMRGGVGGAFQGLGNMNVGLFTINDRVDVTMWDLDSDADKNSFLTKHYNGYTASGGTPLVWALDHAGQQFMRTNSGAPITSECQKNFALVFSDGFRNSGAPSVGNQDGSAGAPYQDSYSNTLGDVAYKYYNTTLRTGAGFPTGAVKVDETCDGTPEPHVDCKKDLHMNTYTVGFGLEGTVYKQDVPNNPGATFTTRKDAHTYKNDLTWPSAPDNSPQTVDDMYHAAVNGFGNMYSANSPTELKSQLYNALQDIVAEAGSGSGVTFNDASLSETGGTGIYATRFVPSNWSGDLIANRLAKDGGESFGGVSYESGEVIPRSGWGLGTTETTDVGAGKILDARNLSTSPRNIITHNGSDGVQFVWDSLTTAQKNDLLNGGTDVDVAKARLDFIRGDRSNEGSGYLFRPRGSRLGDLVNSAPLYVGGASSGWPNVAPFGDATSRYDEWASTSAIKDRKPLVWVGANDGMLHAFDANLDTTAGGGTELFAYVPGGVYDTSTFSGLSYLANPNYVHKYYVDLTPIAQDVYINASYGSTVTGWRTMLVGGYRAGAKGIFALDVTDPTVLTQTDANAAKVALWEFDAADDSDLGYITSTPGVAMMNNQKWAVVFGNGYNSTSGNTALFILYVEGGLDGTWSATDYKKIVLDTSESTDGLSGVTLADIDGDKIVDRIYGGDLKGNLWAFDVSDSNPDKWEVAYKDGNGANAGNVPLFKAVNADNIAQPITAPPNIAFNEETQKSGNEPNLLVGFGTGQYLTLSDNTNTEAQSIYIVWDRGYANEPTALTRANLVQRELEQNATTGVLSVSSATDAAIVWDDGATDADKKYGWYMDLFVNNTKEGERVVHMPLFRNSKKDGVIAVFASRIPDTSSACSGGGKSKLYAIPILTGLPATQPVVDLDGDGDIDADDAGVGSDKGFLINDPNILSDKIYASKGVGEGVDTTEADFGDSSARAGRLGWHERIKK